MFTFIIAALVVAGIIGIIIHASSKPSLKEIEEASKTESHTSDLPFNEDFPIVYNDLIGFLTPDKKGSNNKPDYDYTNLGLLFP
jgi:hypothetical protein